MIPNIIQPRINLFTLPLAGLLWAFGTYTASAIDIFYNVTVDIQSGSLVGDSLTGSLSFEDTQVSGSAFEEVALSSFSFEFDGTEYTESDDLFAFGTFENGSLVGLSYAVFDTSPFQPIFTFESFFGSQFFDYTDPTGVGNDGSGDVRFTALTAPTDEVPEPSSVFGTLLFLGFAGAMQRRKKRQLLQSSSCN